MKTTLIPGRSKCDDMHVQMVHGMLVLFGDRYDKHSNFLTREFHFCTREQIQALVEWLRTRKPGSRRSKTFQSKYSFSATIGHYSELILKSKHPTFIWAEEFIVWPEQVRPLIRILLSLKTKIKR